MVTGHTFIQRVGYHLVTGHTFIQRVGGISPGHWSHLHTESGVSPGNWSMVTPSYSEWGITWSLVTSSYSACNAVCWRAWAAHLKHVQSSKIKPRRRQLKACLCSAAFVSPQDRGLFRNIAVNRNVAYDMRLIESVYKVWPILEINIKSISFNKHSIQ